MASVFDSWKIKYSKEEYEQRVLEYKENLRNHAKKQGLGGVRLVKRTCTNCSNIYEGVHNQLVCNNCKDSGVQLKLTCKHCEKQFVKIKHNSNIVDCCDECKISKPWLRNRAWSDNQKSKFRKSKQKWYKTESGVAHRKKMSKFNSENMKRFNSTPQGIENIKRNAELSSLRMREKIARGEFTPCITNTRTHWEAVIVLPNSDVRKFRSSWEAVFWASNMYLEFESFRIPWIESSGKKRSYIPDFYDSKNRIIYEIKPRCNFIKQDEKMQQAIQYCLDNNIKFIWINEENIINYINTELDIYQSDKNKEQLNKVLYAVTKNTNRIDYKN